MTRDEMVAQVQLYLGMRTDMANTIAAELMRQQNVLERETQWKLMPWFLKSDDSTTSISILGDGFDRRVAKPEDWLADIEEGGLYVIDDDDCEYELVKHEEDSLREYYKTYDPGLPRHYATSGDYYLLFPTPDQAYTLKMKYYQADAVLSLGSSSNRWSRYASNCLIGRAGMFLAGSGNNARTEMFSAMYNESKNAIEVKSFDEQTTNRQYAMGENQ